MQGRLNQSQCELLSVSCHRERRVWFLVETQNASHEAGHDLDWGLGCKTVPSLWDIPLPLSFFINFSFNYGFYRNMKNNAKWFIIFSIIPPTCPALRSYWPTSWVALASPPVVELITAGLGGFFMVPCVGWFSLLISPRVMSFTWTKTSQTISQHKILCVQFLWLQNNLLD